MARSAGRLLVAPSGHRASMAGDEEPVHKKWRGGAQCGGLAKAEAGELARGCGWVFCMHSRRLMRSHIPWQAPGGSTTRSSSTGRDKPRPRV